MSHTVITLVLWTPLVISVFWLTELSKPELLIALGPEVHVSDFRKTHMNAEDKISVHLFFYTQTQTVLAHRLSLEYYDDDQGQ